MGPRASTQNLMLALPHPTSVVFNLKVVPISTKGRTRLNTTHTENEKLAPFALDFETSASQCSARARLFAFCVQSLIFVWLLFVFKQTVFRQSHKVSQE